LHCRKRRGERRRTKPNRLKKENENNKFVSVCFAE
jgi:hypothetical protein